MSAECGTSFDLAAQGDHQPARPYSFSHSEIIDENISAIYGVGPIMRSTGVDHIKVYSLSSPHHMDPLIIPADHPMRLSDYTEPHLSRAHATLASPQHTSQHPNSFYFATEQLLLKRQLININLPNSDTDLLY